LASVRWSQAEQLAGSRSVLTFSLLNFLIFNCYQDLPRSDPFPKDFFCMNPSSRSVLTFFISGLLISFVGIKIYQVPDPFPRIFFVRIHHPDLYTGDVLL
jgi:hypothetical protein